MNPLRPDSALREVGGTLWMEGVPLADIAARFGTPTYVYSRATLTSAFRAYQHALSGHRASICYAVKANSNLGILNLFARLGAGFDIVSGGELTRVLAAGGQPNQVLFSGVGKSAVEIRQAIEVGIRCFNVESAAELERIDSVAGEVGLKAPIAFRVNPDVDPKTHPYIATGLKSSKFGVAFGEAAGLYRRAATMRNVEIRGIACHIGSQLLDPAPIAEAAEKVLSLVDTLAVDGIHFDHVDLGGGLGIRYRDEIPPTVTDYLSPLLALFQNRREALCFEPGRSLVGNSGLLLTRVEYLKHGEDRNFVVVDAAMNDLARPALYDAYHQIVPVTQQPSEPRRYDVVGPVCESGDFLAHDRDLAVTAGDHLAILSAGAYGMAMSSNYNTRPRAAEVLVDGDAVHLVRQRETLPDLYRGEGILPA
ncbi:MAG: diaminopimelate decarboxylase [Zoogloeaceae bacterium]|nr:diaminopimelate decarboxylase [Zoogloeaceae bacterium]